jgi:thiamine kinase-like enzyme
MLLNPLNIPYFLFNENLIAPEEVVCKDFTIHNNHSRNNNFIINKYQDDPLFVKQVKTYEAEKIHTLSREATCYWLADNNPEFSSWKAIMPEYKTFDFNNHILVTAYYPSSSLYDHLKEHPHSKNNISNQMAKILYDCHNPRLPKILQDQYAQYFPSEIPFVFKMASDHFRSGWRQNDAHTRELFELIQSDSDYITSMEKISHQWETSTIIHADIKFQNLLIDPQGQIKIIDWETCDIGDPTWDLAAVFHMYFLAWANGALQSNHKRETSSSILTFTESYMQNQLHEFWNTYGACAGWNEDQTDLMLRKTLSFTALKLVHTSFEITTQSKQVDSYVGKILQLGLNILKDPDSVIKELLNF